MHTRLVILVITHVWCVDCLLVSSLIGLFGVSCLLVVSLLCRCMRVCVVCVSFRVFVLAHIYCLYYY